ncbi:LysR family transcriptional regulator [Aestuariirhabdus litorea]|uniref:LysR family transcriptional regulator n=1 Tax=Aestuariirhabdus litorea TaxID=2528527 RepID=A0A3P3VQ17_9GAMM|nr:LysR family transcriptional regulator [Aestuariirhabdus litorea]RRJ84720.1 LysR family transcriptional regulator [Aestuariirhabdus litorea]RWW97945.1 LysR family transcriptional regulator [Endozoicomonadaceae bacterium GTF-13]
MSRTTARIGTLRQLEILLAVYQHRSITAASNALHLTQPTVSMQLKKLADGVGAPLYDSVGRNLVFTEAGLAVVEGAREVLARIDRLAMTLADLQGMKAGTLRLAVVTTAKYFIPHLLGDFLRHYPMIDVDFKVGNRQQIIDRLGAGEDDFYVFSHPPQEQELALHQFVPNPLVAIAPQDHPLAGEGELTLEAFARQPFLMRELGSGTRHAIERHLERAGVDLNVRMTVESNEAIKHSVMAGLGVSILSQHTLAFGGSQGLATLSVSGLPINTQWFLACLPGKQLSVVARTFLDYVEQEGRAKLMADTEIDR